MALRNINIPSGSNLGSIIRFEFVAVTDVELTSKDSGGTSVKLKTDKNWWIGYGSAGTMGYQEPGVKTNAGTLYARQFAASCPQWNNDNSQLFEEMADQLFLMKYTDANGNVLLVGSLEEPLSFSASFDTKVSVPELAGHVVKFYGDGTFKASLYKS